MFSRNKIRPGWAANLLLLLGMFLGSAVGADETEKRRVDISLSIFPRIVAVDNHFREKLDADKKAYLLFLYDKDEGYARHLVERIQENNQNIGGKYVVANVLSVNSNLQNIALPTAIFIVEKLSDAQLKKVMAFSERAHRLVFSPFSGDVERGVTVGISVTNRVKPYFNLSSLERSKIVINALLMKMSKRYD
ncbi:MAG: hypothetical protein COB30_000365 [Ectothiorhodospiraceae bacterium]|nr:hypothetical protein [Ectothiorhodospiraceae bacterium]